MIPSPQAQADCVRILADPDATRDERDASRLVIRAAQARTICPPSALPVLAGYVRRQQEQTRWGT